MISAYLIAAGPFLMPALLALLVGMIWLALWLLAKGGWWRVTLACLLMAYPVAVALAAVGVIR